MLMACVNALNRANPISTVMRIFRYIATRDMCQCPQSGKSHFYPALLELAYLAALRTCFCGYFSEYSDN